MPFLNVRSAGDIRQAMINAARTEFERITGLTWPVTSLDPQVLSYGVVADAIVELEKIIDAAGSDALPGPASPHLDTWVATSGLVRRSGESNQALWERYLAFRQRGSESTEPGLRQIALDIPHVTDIGFTPQNDGSVTVYIASDEEIDGELPGTSSADLRTQVSDALNDIAVKNITDQFNVREATITRFTMSITVYYPSTLDSTTQLESDLAEMARRYAKDVRGFAQKKPAVGHFLDASHLTQYIGNVENVVRTAVPNFLIASDVGTVGTNYKAGIANGFYSMSEAVHVNPSAVQRGAININIVAAS